MHVKIIVKVSPKIELLLRFTPEFSTEIIQRLLQEFSQKILHGILLYKFIHWFSRDSFRNCFNDSSRNCSRNSFKESCKILSIQESLDKFLEKIWTKSKRNPKGISWWMPGRISRKKIQDLGGIYGAIPEWVCGEVYYWMDFWKSRKDFLENIFTEFLKIPNYLQNLLETLKKESQSWWNCQLNS